ncbi:MAG TPA: CocE/NonD family hydrolase C-terminal non-catalytic domain-containing protein, partial [Polyangiales bacterium]
LPKDTKTPLHLFEMGGPKRWVNSGSYPLVAAYTPLYLSSGGSLSRSVPSSSGKDSLSWGGLWVDAIDYTSEPFAQGGMLAGPLAARIQLTSSNTNAQLALEIYDKAPDGALTRISSGGTLGSLRRTDPVKSWVDAKGLPMRPYLALDQDEPLAPNQPAQLDVPLWPTLWSIEPGHRLVVRIGTRVETADCLGLLSVPRGCSLTEPMNQSLAGGAYSLHRGGDLASFIALPLIERGALASAKSAEAPTRSSALPVAW